MSRILIRRANFKDEAAVISLLEGFCPGIPDHWKKLFAPRSWTVDGEFPGFVLTDNNKIVGFLGLIFSEHDIPGKGRNKFCNLTCWYVDPAYRRHSLPLYLSALQLPEVTWTNFTSTPTIYRWLQKIGFIPINENQTVYLPVPKIINHKQFQILTSITNNDLSKEQQKIYEQHAKLNCKHLLIRSGEESCYCIYVKTKYKKLPMAKIYYLSNAELFNRLISDIRWQICRQLKVCYFLVEGKHKKIFGSWRKKLIPPRLAKSNNLLPNEVPILNSELFVLGI